MKTITVRDLRQRWPEAERRLRMEKELLITRDGTPVAKLVRIVPERSRRQRFDPSKHAAWQKQVFGKSRIDRWTDETLATGRAERSRNG